MKHKIPTTVFSGFLGSGKTTIISNLIDTLQKTGEQVVYIKNEIGDIDIDTKVLSGKGIKSKELLNGCICCTLVGPFITAINEVIETFKPDRIIIEASGAADPSAIALMISSHPLLERDGVIAIIDVVNFTGYKDLSVTSQNQTKFTDLIVFNKIELADLNQKKAVVGYVRELNSHSPIVEAPKGIIGPAVVFGLNTTELEKLLSQPHKAQMRHIHDDEIQSFSISTNKLNNNSNLQKIENILKQLPKNIFRAKGYITNNQGEIYIFNTVGSRTTFSQSTNKIFHNNQENLFIFIGYHAHDHQGEVEKLLSDHLF